MSHRYPSHGRGGGNGGYQGNGNGNQERNRGNGNGSERDRGQGNNYERHNRRDYRDDGSDHRGGSNNRREHSSGRHDQGSRNENTKDRRSTEDGNGSYRRERAGNDRGHQRPWENNGRDGEGSKRPRMDNSPSTSSNCRGRGGGIRGNRPPPKENVEPRARREFLPKDKWLEKLAAEREKDKQDEIRSYDNVVTRPAHVVQKQGLAGDKNGQAISLVANFFKLRPKGSSWILQNYRLDFNPEQTTTRDKRELLKSQAHKLHGYIFEGDNIYTPHVIDGSDLILYCEKKVGENTEKVEITLQHTGTVEPTDIHYLQIYSLIIRAAFRALELDELGRYFYDRNASVKPNYQSTRLQIWPGYTTAVRHYDGGIMLNMDLRHKVLRTDNALQMINSQGYERAQAEIIGNVVITHYNRKTYKINDVNWDMNPLSTFEHEGKEKTFVEYYAQKFPGVKITDMAQPLLVHLPKRKDRHRGQKGPILLIPELCNLTGLSEDHRKDFNLMREIHKTTSTDPDDRVKKLQAFMDRLWGNQKVRETFESWRFRLDKQLATVTGRKLKPEELKLGNGPFTVQGNADWTTSLRDPMYSTVHLQKWVIIVPNQDYHAVSAVMDKLRFVSNGFEFRYNPDPTIVRVSNGRDPTAYVEAIDKGMGLVKDCQLFFVILSSNSSEIYGAVKRKCNIDQGIQSQCFLVKHCRGPNGINASVMTKIVVQINAKLGGIPWAVTNTLEGKTMVVGFDVHHSGKGRKASSIGGMVATTDDTFSKFYSTASVQTEQVTLSMNLCTDFAKCLHAFRKKNGVLPDRIIFYRDGVGQGDLAYVHGTELKQLEGCMEGIYKDGELPGFTFIVVTKKGNARIMMSGTKGYQNPPPGTVVDSVITLPERFDFFLVSQQARGGQTVSPTTYNVLKVSPDLSPERIQILTQKFCHIYYNWSGTIGVPFVCQYAHKLSYLTGTAHSNAQRSVPDSLAHFLYFL